MMRELSMEKPVSISAQTQRNSAGAPLSPRQQQEARNNFEEKLRIVEKRTDEPRSDVNSKGELAGVKRSKSKGEAEDGFDSEGKSERLEPSSHAPQLAQLEAATAATQAAQAPLLSDAQRAHLDRMSAAIAELVDKRNDKVFTVDFGAGHHVAESAIIARDAAGMVTIKLVTPNAAIQPHGWTVLRHQLYDRLEKRKIAVKSFSVGDQRIPEDQQHG
jgi:hypothetical protein